MKALDRLFDVFSEERRRYALYALHEADGPVGIEELAERISQWESGEADVSAETFESLVLSLEHSHLPKASQAEYVEYDRENDQIEISGEPTEFRIVLAVSEAVEMADDGRIVDFDVSTPEDLLSQLTAPVRSNN